MFERFDRVPASKAGRCYRSVRSDAVPPLRRCSDAAHSRRSGKHSDGEIAEHSGAPGSADEPRPNRAPDVPHAVPVREPSPGGSYGTLSRIEVARPSARRTRFRLRRSLQAGSRWAVRTPARERQQRRPWDREGASRDRRSGAGWCLWMPANATVWQRALWPCSVRGCSTSKPRHMTASGRPIPMR